MRTAFPSTERPFRDIAQKVYRSARSVRNRFCNLFDPPLLILLYHRVADLATDPERLAVSPRNFRRQMEYLKRNYRILRFEEAWPVQERPAVVITFDDGYADNALEALPILEEVGIPATFFVSTGHIGTGREFWWHELEAVLLREGDLPTRFQLEDPQYGRAWDVDTPQKRARLYARLNFLMKKIDPERREGWLAQLYQWAGKRSSMQGHRCLSGEELKRLAASPWATVGAHTVTHPALSSLSETAQRKEILSSKGDLERLTGTEVKTFAYPFGRKKDYNKTTVRLCKEVGFTRAAANFPGQVHRWTDPFQIPRHLVRNWTVDLFAEEMRRFSTR